MLRAEEHRPQQNRHRELVLLERYLVDRTHRANDARVVEDAVEPAVTVDHVVHQRGHVRLAGDVAVDVLGA